ncbi:MAG: hypothetical protein LAQ69_37075 [Acidobacteriia bacterium]|nr:hypothetical protein [Terriglobia bacterium]
MAAGGVSVSGLDVRAAEVERLVDSPALRGSESLCRLLRYLANRAIHDPGTAIREHEIAAEVFGRSAAFDPRIDSTVRVNIARLRAKLIDHYSAPGAEDRFTIELPKGSYTLAFHPRPVEVEPEITVPAVMEPPVVRIEQPPRTNRVLVIALACMTGIAAILAATLLLERSGRGESRAVADAGDTRALRRFWGTLLHGPNDPWVVFSNATFVGRPATGMRYLVPSRDSGREVVDFYTGIGEVLGIHALDRTFTLLNRSVRVKRGGLLSLDDVENNDVVFVGSSLENLPLRDVPGLQDFQFQLVDEGPRSGEGALINLAPRQGEPKMFLPSPLPLSEDYAVVGLVPGLNPSRWALILAGTSTIGTQGAVEYVCREDTVRELLNRAGNPKAGSRLLFEAVLDVHIKGGVPVRSEIVLFHTHRPLN